MLKAKSWWIWSDENRGRGKGSFSLTTKLEVYIIWTANPKVVRSNTHTFRTFRTKCTRTKAICRNGRCKFSTIQSSYRFRSFTWVFCCSTQTQISILFSIWPIWAATDYFMDPYGISYIFEILTSLKRSEKRLTLPILTSCKFSLICRMLPLGDLYQHTRTHTAGKCGKVWSIVPSIAWQATQVRFSGLQKASKNFVNERI